MSTRPDLEQVTIEAEAIIARAATEAARVVAAATSEALKTAMNKDTADHDILIEVRTKLEGLKADIRDLKDGTSEKISNHELRICNLEQSKTKQVVLTSLGVALLSLLTSLLVYHIVK